MADARTGERARAPEASVTDGLFGVATWRDVVLIVAAMAAFVALCFAPNQGCSVRINNAPTTTTEDTDGH